MPKLGRDALSKSHPEFHPAKQATNQAVLNIAQANSYKVYLVGGYVRDYLLGRFSSSHRPKDFDFTVLGGSAIELAQRITTALNGHFVPLDESSDTARVVLSDGLQIDLAGCVGGSIDTDIRRRDFTINALAWDPDRPDEILDLIGGKDDLLSRTIRTVSPEAFVEDPLRLLRAFRFAAVLGFDIETATKTQLQSQAHLLEIPAAERKTYELFAIMDTAHTAQTIRLMSELGVLDVLIPEMKPLRKVPPNAYHHLGLYDHSIEVLAQVEAGYESFPKWAKADFAAPMSNQISRLGATKLAGLLHDIGKPDTWQVLENGKHTFIGHDKLGAEMSLELSKLLKWSKPVERFIADLIKWHLRPGALFHQGPPTERAIHRFYRAVKDETPQLVLLALADFRATCGPGLADESTRQLLENQLLELLSGYFKYKDQTLSRPKLLDGRDLMTLLGLEPGPVVGELLTELDEAQLLKEVSTRQEAETFVSTLYKQKYCK